MLLISLSNRVLGAPFMAQSHRDMSGKVILFLSSPLQLQLQLQLLLLLLQLLLLLLQLLLPVLRRHSERSEEALYFAFAVVLVVAFSNRPQNSLLDNLGSRHYLPS
jgi:hypothetical protein